MTPSSGNALPKISVVMAAYNHERYVAQAIDSVLSQRLQDFEIIVVDDASTDRTLDVVRRFRDPRILWSKAAKNRGVSATYNACIAQARGEYVAVLNSDDFFEPEKLERQAALLDARPELGAVFTQVRLVGERGEPLPADTNVFRQSNRSRHAWLRHFFLEGNCLCHPSAMIRKRVHDEVGVYDPRLAQIHDLDLWIRICMRHEIHIVDDPLTCFRLRDDEANANNSRPDTLNRIMWEYMIVVRRYADMAMLEQLALIFPEIDADPDRWDDSDRLNALARLAIQGNRLAHLALALEIMHGLFGSLGIDEVERRFGLSIAGYLTLTGDLDLFRNREIAQLRGS